MRPSFFLLGILFATFAACPAAGQYAEWGRSASAFIITTPEGADLPEGSTVENFPLLVRLKGGSFDFARAQAHGEDIRFATAEGTPLAYQIEEWDAGREEAAIWVLVPEISGNARRELRIFWGNPTAAGESDGAAVFNASNGYLSVFHLGDEIRDEVGTLEPQDVASTAVAGMIGKARHLAGKQGIFGGDKIEGYPTGAGAHSTEAWFRAEQPNATVVAWGNEQAQGKVVMQFRSPPHVRMDCYFSGGNVAGESTVPIGAWTHVVHTYREGESKLYINGVLDGTNSGKGPPLAIESPARLWIGGWYDNFDFVGELDEVRVSKVERSAEWVKLQYENQKPQQTLLGPPVQPGEAFDVSPRRITIAEGQRASVTARAGGAQKYFWTLNQGGEETVVATDTLTYAFDAWRVVGNQTATLQFKAIYPDGVKTRVIAISVTEDLPEPVFTLKAPAAWDGRETIEIVPQIANLDAMEAKDVGRLNAAWSVDGMAVIKRAETGKLVLKRAQNSGLLTVSVAIGNGGAVVEESVQIAVTEPDPASEEWVRRTEREAEQPENNQFIPRGDSNEGTLLYKGMLDAAADSVFVRLYAEDKLVQSESAPVGDDKSYRLAVTLKPGLIRYRTEFGSVLDDRETVLHGASNVVCGDVILIAGQSNAVATDFGNENPLVANGWVRTFGSTEGGPQGARLKEWADAEARGPGGIGEIGYWGMELGRRLVESQKIPICIINGAVGGTRIDQHQRNTDDPTDAGTIYGRLLWRVREAELAHGVRAILWHQGENDQGADGPGGGYGWETYRQHFIDLAAAWKEDYPNVQHYGVFQIWPRACSMGTAGSDNRLREVQRTLPDAFSNLSVMSTLGIKPPGTCHFPAAGYAEFARLIAPVLEEHLYGKAGEVPVTPANLKRAFFTGSNRDGIILEFDQEVVWQDALTSEFYLDGAPGLVASGAADGNRITLKLDESTQAGTITYIDGASWSPDNLLYGQNGIAALTFCEVPIAEE